MHLGGYDQTIVDKFKEYNNRYGKNTNNADGIYWMDINSDIHW